MANWPRDVQSELIKFYGDPGNGEVAKQLVRVVPPFQMYYDGRPLKSISFHKKAAPALKAALDEIWEHYGRNQAVIDRLGISKCAGTYNPRKVRGGNNWSSHAFGAAIDFNAAENGFNMKSTIPQPVIDAFKRQGARWGGDYRGRKDPMHFEFCQDATVRTAALGAIDLPHMDGDSDFDDGEIDMTPPPHHDVPPDAPIPADKPSLLKRIGAWLTGGGVTLGGFFYDYRVALIVAGCLIVLVLFLLWLFGKQRIADWISRQVN